MARDKIYTAQIVGKQLKIINAARGTVYTTVHINGEVVSGPIITDDKCTLIIKNPSGGQRGVVYNLPRGTISLTFNA